MSTTSHYAWRILPEIASVINDYDRYRQRPANHCGKESIQPRRAAQKLGNWLSFGHENGSSQSGSWRWNVPTGALRIFGFDPEKPRPSYSMFLERIHPEDRPLFEQTLHGSLWEDGDFEHDYRIILPDGTTKFLRSAGRSFVNQDGEPEFIGTVIDITELKRVQEMKAALAHERELFTLQRATELAKANEALRGCVDALVSVPELDEFLGQMMAAITRQLGAVSSTSTQASLAIELTRLAKTARQSAVLEERNRMAGEIHDSLAQSFAGISMQLAVVEEEMAANEGGLLSNVRRANEMAKFGLTQARRSILSLSSSAIQESGLTTTLQHLVERSNVAGRLRCDFRSNWIPEESLPATVQHQLLRIAQEAISNAVRHAKPTLVSVTLRWEQPNLILLVTDNGSGISRASLEKSEGFGLSNMRTRASQIDGKLDIQTAAGHGTSIVLIVPI
jgi:signal transduction histidine kinase